jgi:hypothetical protein
MMHFILSLESKGLACHTLIFRFEERLRSQNVERDLQKKFSAK